MKGSQPGFRRQRMLLIILGGVSFIGLLSIPVQIRLQKETALINRQIAEKRNASLSASSILSSRIYAVTEAIKSQPHNPSLHAAYASLLQTKGDLAGAEQEWRNAVHYSPGNASLLAALGACCDSRGEDDLAIDAYRKALKANPDNLQAITGLTFRYLSLGWNHPALTLLMPALKKFPNSAPLLILRGMIAFQTGQYGDAVNELETVQKLKPNDLSVLLPLIQSLEMSHQNPLALQTIQAAMSVVPDKTELYIQQGQVYKDMQQPDQAIKSLESALKLSHNNIQAQYLLGIALRSKGDINGASAEWAKVYTLDPKYSHVALLLGQARIAQGDAVLGQKLLNEYIAQNRDFQNVQRLSLTVLNLPNSPQAHTAIANYYMTIGSYARALAEYKEALRLNSGDSSARHGIRQALIKAGRNY